MTRRFAVTFDYLCPFARNAHEHLIAGLQDGADWEVRFTPYSLAQGHVDDEATPVWDRDEPLASPGVLALAAGITVRDRLPDRFLAAHGALFAARHDHGQDIKDPEVVRHALDRVEVDGAAVLRWVAQDDVLARLRAEHDAGVAEHEVWGVPTFIGSARAAFVRLLDRPQDHDRSASVTTVEQVLLLLDSQVNLHEFKQTDLGI